MKIKVSRKSKRERVFRVVRPSSGVIAYVHRIVVFPLVVFLDSDPPFSSFPSSLIDRRGRLQGERNKTSHLLIHRFGLPIKAAPLLGAVILNFVR